MDDRVIIGVAICAILVIAGWIRSQWQWLEYRITEEVPHRIKLVCAIVFAAALGLAAMFINLKYPDAIPKNLRPFIVGIPMFTIPLIVFGVGAWLCYRDLRSGTTIKIGEWVGSHDVTGPSRTDVYRIVPCYRTTEPSLFYWQVVKLALVTFLLFSVLAAVAALVTLPLIHEFND